MLNKTWAYSAHRARVCSANSPTVVTMWSQSCLIAVLQLTLKLFPRFPKVVTMSSLTCLKVVFKLSLMASTCCLCSSQVVPSGTKWSQMVANILRQFLSDPSPIVGYPCHSLTHFVTFSRLDWCDPGVWILQHKYCWGNNCWWYWCWDRCWRQIGGY